MARRPTGPKAAAGARGTAKPAPSAIRAKPAPSAGPAQPAPSVGPAKPSAPTGSAKPEPSAPAPPVPPAALRLAAVAQAVEAAGLAVAAVFSVVSTADGRSYKLASGIVLTVIAIGTAIGLAAIAVALAKARPWTRIPTAMAQLFVIIGGITLLDGHRPEWGVPALLLAAACLAGLLTPASLRALNRPPAKTPPSSRPAGSKSAGSKPGR